MMMAMGAFHSNFNSSGIFEAIKLQSGHLEADHKPVEYERFCDFFM